MYRNVFDVLEERGYFSQATHRDEIYELLSKPGVSFYIGFDPTADSLHVGHFVQMMVMSHMQKAKFWSESPPMISHDSSL